MRGSDISVSDHHKRKGKVTATHVMTSFRDSIALSSFSLSGLSSGVCFFTSAMEEEKRETLCKKETDRKRWKSRRPRRVEKNSGEVETRINIR